MCHRAAAVQRSVRRVGPMAPLAHSLVLLSCTGSFAYHARPVLVQPHRATRTLPTVASAAPTPFESRETLANGEARTDGSSEDHTNLHHYPSGIGEAGAVPDPRDEHLQSHMVDVVHEGAGARWQPQANADEVSSEEASGVGSRTEGTLLMLAVAMLWGSNFPAVKATLEAGLPGSAAAALRFSVAALALLPLLKPPEGEKELPRELVLGGLECGCWLALGYIAQSLALHDLPAGTVAFLASLQVGALRALACACVLSRAPVRARVLSRAQPRQAPCVFGPHARARGARIARSPCASGPPRHPVPSQRTSANDQCPRAVRASPSPMVPIRAHSHRARALSGGLCARPPHADGRQVHAAAGPGCGDVYRRRGAP